MKRKISLFLVLFSLTYLCYSENSINPKDSLKENNLAPLSSVLSEDGTINTDAKISASFNPAGYKMITQPGKAPRFVQIDEINNRVAGDEFWENPYTVSSFASSSTVYAIAVDGTNIYVGGAFFDLAGDPNADNIAKWDGTKWIGMGTGGSNGNIYAITVYNSDVYAGGYFSTIGGLTTDNIAQWDNSLNTWYAMGSGVNGVVRALAVYGGTIYAGGLFTSASGVANTNHIAKFSSSWTALGTGTDDEVDAIVADGSGNIYVGGNFTNAGGIINTSRIAKWNGATWSALGIGMDYGVQAIAINGTEIYAGGFFTLAGGIAANNLAKWNGSSWSSVPGIAGGAVNALKFVGTDLYVGGAFSSAGGIPNTNCIAKWSGTSWSALGTGLNWNVFAINASGLNVFAGGWFTNAGGDNNADYFATWNQSNWQGYSTGINNTIRAIAVDGTNIYVGGSFQNAGGVNNANNIAMWDGYAWSALGSGVNGSVSAIKVMGSNIFVGGNFSMAGTVSNTAAIARWNNGMWYALGNGLSCAVTSLEVIGTNLYVGGCFSAAGGNANANNIAKWNGTTWSALGTGVNGMVMTIKAMGSDLFVGGDFTAAGGNSNGTKIARWDGSSWNALGTGLNCYLIPGPPVTVMAIETNGTDVFVGGTFCNIGGNPNFNYITKWNGSTWDSLGTSPNSSVYALKMKGNSLFVGGGFVNLGGNANIDRIAKWENGNWTNLGSGINSVVYTIEADNNYLYCGGTFTLAGDKMAIDFARFGTLPSISTQPLTQVTCVGQNVTFNVNTNGADPKTFQWKFNGSNIIGATDSILTINSINIANQGSYNCIINNPCGSVISDTVSLTVNALPNPVITGNSAYCAGLSTNLTTTLSYSGYLWSTTSGLSTINVTSPGNYYVTVTDAAGCSNTSSVFAVTENPLPNVNVIPNQSSICLHSSTAIIASGANTYFWTPATGLSATTGNNVAASPLSTISYTVTGTDGNGCENTSSITIDVKQPFLNEVICEVNIDTTVNKNFIVWEKTPNVGTAYFKIWKETSFGGVYAVLDSVMYDSMSVYKDLTSNAAVKSDRYKLSVVDTCGNESSQSPAHKTLHLTVNQGIGNTINLIWENYEGFAFGSYYIYRGLSPSTMVPIDTIPNTITTYSDINPPLTFNYYQIVIAKTDSCVASSNAKTQTTQTFNTSVSNMEEYKLIGIDEIGNHNFDLIAYPNPFNQNTNIVYTLTKESIVKMSVFNILGEKILEMKDQKQSKGRNTFTSNFPQLNSGVYFLNVEINGVSQTIKIVKY
ncbi:MAG: T9SS type A sorting domain-containing protein [Bacteroidetes bacterium]|nr:T9SS type A sorting domain-containing protein [Bacteroidota bacterium]